MLNRMGSGEIIQNAIFSGVYPEGYYIQWNPNFWNLQGKQKFVREMEGKSVVFD